MHNNYNPLEPRYYPAIMMINSLQFGYYPVDLADNILYRGA